MLAGKSFDLLCVSLKNALAPASRVSISGLGSMLDYRDVHAPRSAAPAMSRSTVMCRHRGQRDAWSAPRSAKRSGDSQHPAAANGMFHA